MHLADGIQGGGVIPVELLADVREGQIGQLADQIHGNLPGFGCALVFLGSTKDRFFHIVEFADLIEQVFHCIVDWLEDRLPELALTKGQARDKLMEEIKQNKFQVK